MRTKKETIELSQKSANIIREVERIGLYKRCVEESKTAKDAIYYYESVYNSDNELILDCLPEYDDGLVSYFNSILGDVIEILVHKFGVVSALISFFIFAIGFRTDNERTNFYYSHYLTSFIKSNATISYRLQVLVEHLIDYYFLRKLGGNVVVSTYGGFVYYLGTIQINKDNITKMINKRKTEKNKRKTSITAEQIRDIVRNYALKSCVDSTRN